MISIKKENNELKISFDKFNIGFVKNIPFLILSIMLIPFVYYTLSFLIILINNISLYLLHSLPIIYNTEPFYKLILLFILSLSLFDICVFYKLFPKCKLSDILYERTNESEMFIEAQKFPIKINILCFFLIFSTFYLIGFFGDPKYHLGNNDINFLEFCLILFHALYAIFVAIMTLVTSICNILYFLDLRKNEDFSNE